MLPGEHRMWFSVISLPELKKKFCPKNAALGFADSLSLKWAVEIKANRDIHSIYYLVMIMKER